MLTLTRSVGESIRIGEDIEVYVVDVAKASVLTTLKAKSGVEGLAFSPDGKWLAVGTRPSIPAGTAPDRATA